MRRAMAQKTTIGAYASEKLAPSFTDAGSIVAPFPTRRLWHEPF